MNNSVVVARRSSNCVVEGGIKGLEFNVPMLFILRCSYVVF